jgi:gas vesicle protein
MLDGAAQAITGEDLDNPMTVFPSYLFISKAYNQLTKENGMENREIVVKRSSVGSLLSGFLIGGLIGAAVALLAAPQSGSETRAMIGDRASELRDRATDIATDTRDRATKVIASARDQATDVINKTKDRVSDVTQRGGENRQIGEIAHQ